MRALIIDDAKAMRSLLGITLKDLGFEVFDAADGRAGLRQLKAMGQTDVVLCDWNMPVMNGYEFVCAMRADHAYDSIRLMMVTTETEMDYVIKALEAGANEYVMKPFTKEIILEKLKLMGLLVG